MRRTHWIVAISTTATLGLGAGLAHAGTIAGATTTAEYFFNSNTNDSSGNGYNGAVSGTTAYTAGPGGRSAFSFDGGSNIATTSTNNLGIYQGSFTVDAWVNFNDISVDRAVLGTTGGGTDQGLHLQDRNQAIMMGFYSDDLQPNTPTINTNIWYNVAWVYDSSTGTQSIYINGSSVASSNGHNNFNGNGQTAYIGQDCCGHEMSGAISNLFVFNSALTGTQIQAAAAVVPEPSTFALIGLGSLAALRRRRTV